MSTQPHPNPDESNAPLEAAGPVHRLRYSFETAKRIARSIRTLGVSEARAATLAGITPQVLYNWKERRPKFAHRLAEARAAYHEATLVEFRREKEQAQWRRRRQPVSAPAATGSRASRRSDAVSPADHALFELVSPELLRRLQQRRFEALDS